jgi:hypothetical protein
MSMVLLEIPFIKELYDSKLRQRVQRSNIELEPLSSKEMNKGYFVGKSLPQLKGDYLPLLFRYFLDAYNVKILLYSNGVGIDATIPNLCHLFLTQSKLSKSYGGHKYEDGVADLNQDLPSWKVSFKNKVAKGWLTINELILRLVNQEAADEWNRLTDEFHKVFHAKLMEEFDRRYLSTKGFKFAT